MNFNTNLSSMQEEYPYFIYPAVMALRQGVDDPAEEKRLRRIVAANVGDIPALRLMLGLDPQEFASFYPDLALPELTTDATISSFLSSFGSVDAPLPPIAAEIDAPLPLSLDTAEVPEEPRELPITEQTACILIKKRDYQGALEIIQQLSLNIPEKSIYFADQIRFLKKLIVNEARKNV